MAFSSPSSAHTPANCRNKFLKSQDPLSSGHVMHKQSDRKLLMFQMNPLHPPLLYKGKLHWKMTVQTQGNRIREEHVATCRTRQMQMLNVMFIELAFGLNLKMEYGRK